MDYCSEKKVPQIETLDDLIASLRLIFDSDNIDVNFVQDVMYAYKSNPNEWRKYAHFDKHRYETQNKLKFSIYSKAVQ
jgi:cysteine dioxygenase